MSPKKKKGRDSKPTRKKYFGKTESPTFSERLMADLKKWKENREKYVKESTSFFVIDENDTPKPIDLGDAVFIATTGTSQPCQCDNCKAMRKRPPLPRCFFDQVRVNSGLKRMNHRNVLDFMRRCSHKDEDGDPMLQKRDNYGPPRCSSCDQTRDIVEYAEWRRGQGLMGDVE